MSRRPFPLITLLLTVAVLAAAPVTPGLVTSAAAVDVWGDDEGDRYVGSGGLILPGSVDQATRQEVAACTGCAWRLASPCVTPDAGRPFDGQPACMSVVRGCPGGELLRSWFRPSGGGWRETGLVCLPPGPPLTVAHVGSAAADRVEALLPRLRPRIQPADGVLTQLPVLFQSGQPAGDRDFEATVLGRAVGISATPGWLWTFGDGAEARTSDPGDVYPRGGVAHVYRAARQFEVTCTAHWTATFTVDGLGPFPVPGPIRQEVTLTVSVGEGRALLSASGTPGRTPAPGMTQ